MVNHTSLQVSIFSPLDKGLETIKISDHTAMAYNLLRKSDTFLTIAKGSTSANRSAAAMTENGSPLVTKFKSQHSFPKGTALTVSNRCRMSLWMMSHITFSISLFRSFVVDGGRRWFTNFGRFFTTLAQQFQ